jgi:hypothetical protein
MNIIMNIKCKRMAWIILLVFAYLFMNVLAQNQIDLASRWSGGSTLTGVPNSLFDEPEPIEKAVQRDCIPNDADVGTIACALGCVADDEAKKIDCWCTECGVQECCPGYTAKVEKKNKPPVLKVEVKPEKLFFGAPTVFDHSGKECLAVVTAIGSDEEDDESELEYKFTASGGITGEVGSDWNSNNELCLPPGGIEDRWVITVLARDSQGALSNEVTVIVSLEFENHPPVLRVAVEPEKPFVGGSPVYDNSGKECLAVVTAVGSDEEDRTDLEYKFTGSSIITGVGGGWNSENDICIPPGEPEGSNYVEIIARDSQGALSEKVTVMLRFSDPEDIEDFEKYDPIKIYAQPTENKGTGSVEWSGHEYEAVYTPDGISWDDAKAAAKAKGGHLVSITSEAENQFVYGLVEDDKFWYWDGYDGNGPWLGGYQEQGSFEPDRGWVWSGPESFEYTNWGRGEPNNGGVKTGGVEDNLEFIGKGTLKGNEWNDKPGSTREKGYIIEW